MARPIKMLLIGESGVGKTGALASLCAAGYNVRHIDVDNGASSLIDLLTGVKSKYPKTSIDHYRWETLSEKMRFTSDGRIVPATAKVWQQSVKLMEDWKGTEKKAADYGLPQDLPAEHLKGIYTWTDKDVLAIDTLTTLGTSAVNFHLSLNSALGNIRTQNEWRRDIGAAQGYLDTLLQLVTGAQVQCNVILITHITYAKEDGTLFSPGEKDPSTGMDLQPTGFPATIGRAQTKNMGKLFNDILLVKRVGSTGTIYTKTQGLVRCKNSAPTRVKDQYSQETGLAQYFKDVRGES